MKKFKLFTILLFIGFGMANAQTLNSEGKDFLKNWKLGAKAGFNVSNKYGDVGNNAFLPFFHFGAVADKVLIEKLILSTEPHISGEGQNFENGFERVIYFNIPVLAKYEICESVSIDGGLHFAIKLMEKTKHSGSSERRNRYNIPAGGLTFGTTYKIYQNWFVQGRMNFKVPDVIKRKAGDSEGSTILAFQFSAGYFFIKE